jgi:heterodisulfide reductase subunit B2
MMSDIERPLSALNADSERQALTATPSPVTTTRRSWFFPGCSQETAAGYAESLDAVCQALGLELPELPGWECCGASTFFSLDSDEALVRVARTLALAERQGAEQIVTGCNGCYSTLNKGRKMILSSQEVRGRVQEELRKENLHLSTPVPVIHLLEVLARDVPPETWDLAIENGQRQSRPEERLSVASYYGCLFSRVPGNPDDPQHPAMLDDLLARLGFEVVDHGAKTACCGASHMLPHGQATRGLVQRIIRTMQDRGATVAATICPLCQFNLDSGQRGLDLAPMPVLFVTQLIGLALGLSPARLGLNKLLVRIEKP